MMEVNTYLTRRVLIKLYLQLVKTQAANFHSQPENERLSVNA